MASQSKAVSPITRDHGAYVGFGMVIHQFALVDAALEDAIREMLGLERHQAAFLMPQLRHEQKRQDVSGSLGKSQRNGRAALERG